MSTAKTTLLIFSLLFFDASIFAKGKKKLSNRGKFKKEYNLIAKQFRKKEIDERGAWQAFAKLAAKYQKSIRAQDQSRLVQAQAVLLQKAGYPIAASIYAAHVLSRSKDPFAKTWLSSWKMIKRSADEKTTFEDITELAGKLGSPKKGVPRFGNDWNFFLGLSNFEKKDFKSALKYFQKLKMGDSLFVPAKFQEAMVFLELKDPTKAGDVLNRILNPTVLELSPILVSKKKEILDYVYLSLGRIHYESKNFKKATESYRKISRKSPLFYNALFEQSWSLFMSGYPSHALGMLYSVESPFFANHYNPEASILRAISFYWMCQYDHAKSALASFVENYSNDMTAIDKFVERKDLSPKKMYALFEDFLSGVSESSLGLSRRVLNSAATSESVMPYRNRYADIIEELNQLKETGVFGSKLLTQGVAKELEGIKKLIQNRIGKAFFREIKHIHTEFQRLKEQSDFLYVELLMSEKEQILGRELHSESKLKKASYKQKVKSWSKESMAWSGDDKNEFWWDEVGFHISKISSNCK